MAHPPLTDETPELTGVPTPWAAWLTDTGVGESRWPAATPVSSRDTCGWPSAPGSAHQPGFGHPGLLGRPQSGAAYFSSDEGSDNTTYEEAFKKA